MKVIKQADTTTWKYEHTCVACDSVLEVVASDLWHRTIIRNEEGPDGDQFYANCAVCSTEFIVPEGKLTKAVKFKAKQRTKPSGGYFDR